MPPSIIRLPGKFTDVGVIESPASSIVRAATELAPTILVKKTVSAMLNGVDVFKYFGAQNPVVNAKLVALNHPIFFGDVDIDIAQEVSVGLNKFFYGDSWSSKIEYTGKIPTKFKPYRVHDGAFIDGKSKLQSMDPIWNEHKDARVIQAMLEAYWEQSVDFYGNMIQVKRRSSILTAEGVDRRRIAFVTFTGAIGDVVDFNDVQVLYDKADATSNKYVYGIDFTITKDKIPVFISNRSPGRINVASIPSGGLTFPAKPGTGYASKASIVLNNNIEHAVFIEKQETIYSIDFFIKPPQDPSLVPASGSDSIGKIFLTLPDGSKKFIFDPTIKKDGFGGQIVFDPPINLKVDQSIRIKEDRSISGFGVADPNIEVSLWFNKRVTLIGPDYHIDSPGLEGLWLPAIGCVQSGRTISDRIKLSAVLQARTKKDIASFSILVDALLDVPIAPHNGLVSDLSQPDIDGSVDGQVDISGSILEFDSPLLFSVNVGDFVSFLQPILEVPERALIDDVSNNASFMDGDDAIPYIRSKMIQAVVDVPDEFRDPTGVKQEIDYARDLLKPTSFRITLGKYASRKFVSSPENQDHIFRCIDAVKPSGTDYWIRLSDGRGVVRVNPANIVIDVSSKLDLNTDYARRIYNKNDPGFATGQFEPAYIEFRGGKPKVGDVYQITLTRNTPAPVVDVYATTLTADDFTSDPITPINGVFSRLAILISASVATTAVNLDTVYVVDGIRKIKFTPKLAASYSLLKYTNPSFYKIELISGSGTPDLFPITNKTIVPGDISRKWTTSDLAIKTMDSYKELVSTITASSSGLTAADDYKIQDNGAGPYDPTFIELADADTLSLDSDSVVVDSYGFSVGRASLVGVESLAFPVPAPDPRDANVYLSASSGFLGDIVVGDKFTLSFFDGVTTTAIDRIALASDPNPNIDSVLAGLAGNVNKNLIVAQAWEAKYDTSGVGFIKLVPKNPFTAANWTVTFSSNDAGVTVTTKTSTPGGPPTTTSGVSAIAKPPNVFFGNLNITFKYNTGAPVTIIPLAPFSADFVVDNFQDVTGGSGRYEHQVRVFPIQIAATPLKFQCDIIYSGVGTPIDGARPNIIPRLRLFEVKFVSNNYPEYSRDDDTILFDDPFKFSSRRGTWSHNGPGTPEPCITNPEDAPFIYMENTITELDATSRLLTPSQAAGIVFKVTYEESECYAADPGIPANFATPADATTYPLRQLVCPATASSMHYVPTFTRLYAYNETTGVYTALVLGVDYTEQVAAQPTDITTSGTFLADHPGVSKIVGYAKSTESLRYYDGPEAKSITLSSKFLSAYGNRVYQDSVFREAAMKKFLSPPTYTGPFDLTSYATKTNASTGLTVPQTKEMSLDDDVIKLSDLFKIKKGF